MAIQLFFMCKYMVCSKSAAAWWPRMGFGLKGALRPKACCGWTLTERLFQDLYRRIIIISIHTWSWRHEITQESSLLRCNIALWLHFPRFSLPFQLMFFHLMLIIIHLSFRLNAKCQLYSSGQIYAGRTFAWRTRAKDHDTTLDIPQDHSKRWQWHKCPGFHACQNGD